MTVFVPKKEYIEAYNQLWEIIVESVLPKEEKRKLVRPILAKYRDVLSDNLYEHLRRYAYETN